MAGRKLFSLLLVFLCLPVSVFAKWNIDFKENSGILSLKFGEVTVSGKLSFVAEGKKWEIANSRDGVGNRLCIVDNSGDVQGYIVFPSNCPDSLKILFYHRTAQAYKGKLSFDGEIIFAGKLSEKSAYACRTRPSKSERVLGLNLNSADSLLNDSIFLPDSDSLLRIGAANLAIRTISSSKYKFSASGRIDDASESCFEFSFIENYFKSSYVPYYRHLDRSKMPATPSGWMSWNTYFDTATADDNLSEAKIGRKYLQPFGCEIWSIESWQGNSDKLPVSGFHNMNLETNVRQFPDGMKKLAQDIRALGFKPGIWMAPFGTGNEDFYKAHKSWFLHDVQGNPISSWNGKYTLDPTVPEAREHLRKIFEIASKEWGYEFFKIDGMSGRNKSYCAHLYERPEIRERFKHPDCPNPFELCVEAFRDGIGDDAVFLACQGHTSGPEAKYAQLSRTGADIVHPNQPVRWQNVKLQGRCTINQIFTHNIAMVADPDTLLVKDLPPAEARTTATIVALPGQLTFFGDKLAGLSQSQMKILQQTLPPAIVRPASLYPYFSMLPIWNLSARHPILGGYNVIAFINWEDDEREIAVSAEELGIDGAKKYLGFEFWTQKPLGVVDASNISQTVPAHDTRLLVLVPLKSGIPQLIGSDRHISNSFGEIKSCVYDDASKVLSLEVEAVAGFPMSLWFNIPEGMELESCFCGDESKCETSVDGRTLKTTFVKSPESKDGGCVFVSLKFR